MARKQITFVAVSGGLFIPQTAKRTCARTGRDNADTYRACRPYLEDVNGPRARIYQVNIAPPVVLETVNPSPFPDKG
ncbi:hypothetical protein BDN72DRAFT_849885 [Pluteus cervinus]|uniref:Uncharacterized protein n=1 Tax=Pluteus cervinus TaxID=181527 RepID=A0ACD3A757_9AGAR|nr:hypothetical protein BDN72DRAFT_849885 [Pluteus cervinus]